MRRVLFLAAGLAALTLAASCGYGNSSPTGPSGLESPPAGATIINVVGDRGTQSFSPDPATVPVGQLVSWHNVDTTSHHVVLNDGKLDAGNLSPGRYSAAMTLAAPGPYHCTIHPGMVGTILTATPTSGATITFGDRDCLNLNCYGATDPTAGAMLQGLAPGVVSIASNSFVHPFPISPVAGDFAGTDQVFVGSVLTAADDGYAAFGGRLNGPQVFTLDYNSLITGGTVLDALTLGIAADDFNFPFFGQPFAARVNGLVDAALTTLLNAIQGGGPRVQFFTIGLSPSVDPGTHILTLSIDEGGNGGDGWAVDFLTIGVTTRAAGPGPVDPWP